MYRKSTVMITVEHRGFSSACWIWKRAKNKAGYGSLHRDGRKQNAHRYFYQKIYGDVPAGLELDHLCRNHDCVRPDHLEPVTRAENIRRGLLTKFRANVPRVRELSALGMSTRKIAKMLGMTQASVCRMANGRLWKGEVSPTLESLHDRTADVLDGE